MLLETYTQQPRERRKYVVNCVDWLPPGEELRKLTLFYSAESSDTFVVNDELLLLDSTGQRATAVSFFVEGGIDGRRYVVNMLFEVSDGQRREDELAFQIREIE